MTDHPAGSLLLAAWRAYVCFAFLCPRLSLEEQVAARSVIDALQVALAEATGVSPARVNQRLLDMLE